MDHLLVGRHADRQRRVPNSRTVFARSCPLLRRKATAEVAPRSVLLYSDLLTDSNVFVGIAVPGVLRIDGYSWRMGKKCSKCRKDIREDGESKGGGCFCVIPEPMSDYRAQFEANFGDDSWDNLDMGG